VAQQVGVLALAYYEAEDSRNRELRVGNLKPASRLCWQRQRAGRLLQLGAVDSADFRRGRGLRMLDQVGSGQQGRKATAAVMSSWCSPQDSAAHRRRAVYASARAAASALWQLRQGGKGHTGWKGGESGKDSEQLKPQSLCTSRSA